MSIRVLTLGPEPPGTKSVRWSTFRVSQILDALGLDRGHQAGPWAAILIAAVNTGSAWCRRRPHGPHPLSPISESWPRSLPIFTSQAGLLLPSWHCKATLDSIRVV